MKAIWRTSQPNPPPPPKKKSPPEKNSLYFRKWIFLALILKKFLYSLKRKLFLYFLKRKLFLYFQKRNPALFRTSSKNKRNPPRENSLYFRKWKPQNGNSKKLLFFQEVTCKARKTNKKYALKKFLVSCDVFAIFTSVEHMVEQISYEAKNKTQI